tara:strand:+ start:1395 stop:1703 length:309 start_codon:yes stop_codon:yes gene_type:complete
MSWKDDLDSFVPDSMGDILDQLNVEASRLFVSTEVRRFGKKVTLVKGFEKGSDMKKIAKKLKSKCATGGTIKDDCIVLQGNQIRRAKEILLSDGYNVEIRQN